MSLDSKMQLVLEHYERLAPLPIETLSPENARNMPTLKNAVEEMPSEHISARLLTVAKPMLEPVGKIEHILIPSPEGDLLARVYTPKGEGPFPLLLYFHGGGWVIAGLDTYESSCRALCNAAKAVVVSVAYRQAPEYKYPAAVNDAYAALQWLMVNAAAVNSDPARVVVCGESAGANLATVACLKAKSEQGLLPLGQLLIYPMTGASMDTLSYLENTETKPLYSAMMPWFFHHYLAQEEQRSDPFVAPLLAPDLGGLPPALVITAEFDPLRDEGEAYAKRLTDAGIAVQCTRYEGVTHEFFGLSGVVGKAKDAVEEAAAWLRLRFNLD